METYLAFAKEEAEYVHYYFFKKTIYTGMRKGELMVLQWDNVDFLRNTIKVDQTRLYRKEKRGQLELSTPKTESGF
jgi:integrase